MSARPAQEVLSPIGQADVAIQIGATGLSDAPTKEDESSAGKAKKKKKKKKKSGGESQTFKKVDMNEVIRWDYCLAWHYTALENLKSWPGTTGFPETNDLSTEKKRQDKSPLYIETFNTKTLPFTVKDGSVSNVSADYSSRIREGDFVVQIGASNLQLQERDDDDPSKNVPTNERQDNDFQEALAAQDFSSKSISITVHFFRNDYALDARCLELAGKYRDDQMTCGSLEYPPGHPKYDAARIKLSFPESVYLHSDIHATLKAIKRAKVGYMLRVEHFDDEADTSWLQTSGVLFVLIGVTHQRLMDELKSNKRIKLQLDSSACQRLMRRKYKVRLGDSAFITLYLEGVSTSICFNLNRRSTLRQIKKAMIRVLRDCCLDFGEGEEKVYVDKLMSFGFKRNNIYFREGSVAKDLVLNRVEPVPGQKNSLHCTPLVLHGDESKFIQDHFNDGEMYVLTYAKGGTSSSPPNAAFLDAMTGNHDMFDEAPLVGVFEETAESKEYRAENTDAQPEMIAAENHELYKPWFQKKLANEPLSDLVNEMHNVGLDPRLLATPQKLLPKQSTVDLLRRPVPPNKVVSNYVDNMEVDYMMNFGGCFGLGKCGAGKKFPRNGVGYPVYGKRFQPREHIFAPYEEDLASGQQTFYRKYRPNPKLVDSEELVKGSKIFGVKIDAGPEETKLIHCQYDATKAPKLKPGGTQLQSENGILATKNRLNVSVIPDNVRIKLVREMLENFENHTPRGANLNLERMVEEGSLTKFFVLHSQNEVKKLADAWHAGSKKKTRSLSTLLFPPVPLTSVVSVHNQETLRKNDEYKTQVPGLREYFGEDIAFYFAFLNFYNQYLVWLAIIGFIAQAMEFLSWGEHDDKDLGQQSTSRQVILFMYMGCLLIWQLLFLELWKKKMHRLSKEWGMGKFKSGECDRIQFKGGVVKAQKVGIEDLRICILPSAEDIQDFSTVVNEKREIPLGGKDLEEAAKIAFLKDVTKRKLKKLRSKKGKAPKYKSMKIDGKMPDEWGNDNLFNGVASACRVVKDANFLQCVKEGTFEFDKKKGTPAGTVPFESSDLCNHKFRAKLIIDETEAGFSQNEKAIRRVFGKSDRLPITITKITEYPCYQRWCCRKKDSCEIRFDEMYDVTFTQIPHPRDGEPFTFDPPGRSVFRNIISWIITLFLIALVIVINFILIFLRIKWTLTTNAEGVSEFDTSTKAVLLGYLVIFLTAVIITVFNAMYSTVAIALTKFENHRTESGYQTSRVLKVFMFQFISSFFALFYTAFMKGSLSENGEGLKIYGYGPDICMKNSVNGQETDCMYELATSVISLFISMMIVSNIFEVGFGKLYIEFLKLWLKCCGCCFTKQHKRDFTRKNIKAKEKSVLMQQFFLDGYLGTHDDYAELIVQFGYVTLFASAFPLSPVLALVNNYFIEAPLDKTKLLYWRCRSDLVSAQDIGAWMFILEMMGILTITTNVAICIFTSGAFTSDMNSSSRWLWFWVIEHLVLLGRAGIAYFIPDSSQDVKIQMERQSIMVKKLMDMEWEISEDTKEDLRQLAGKTTGRDTMEQLLASKTETETAAGLEGKKDV